MFCLSSLFRNTLAHSHTQTKTQQNKTRFKSLDARLGADERREQQRALLASMQAAAADMARALGAEHLLVSGAARYIAQLSVLSGLHPLSP